MKKLKIILCAGVVAANASSGILRDITNKRLSIESISTSTLSTSPTHLDNSLEESTFELPIIDFSRPSTPRATTPTQINTPRPSTPRKGLSLEQRRQHMRSISLLNLVYIAPLYPNSRSDEKVTSHIDHEIEYQTLGLRDYENAERKLTQKIADSLIPQMLASREVEKLSKALVGLKCHKAEDPDSEKKLQEFIQFHEKLLITEKRKLQEANRSFEDATIKIDSLRKRMKEMGEGKIQNIENTIYQKVNNASCYIPDVLDAMISRRN